MNKHVYVSFLLLSLVSTIWPKSPPKLTIIASVKNDNDSLEAFLSCITKQTIFNKCELILHGLDTTRSWNKIVNRYIKQYPQISYVVQQDNFDLLRLRTIAHAPYIIFLESDATLKSKYLEDLLVKQQDEPSIQSIEYNVVFKNDTKCCPDAHKPKISIITPILKGDRVIREFLSDMVRQTIFDQCELLLIIRNSPENEELVILEYMKEFPNIHYIKLGRDPGISGALSTGIDVALGDYLTIASLDYRFASDCYNIHATTLDANLEIDLVYSDHYVLPGSKTFIEAQSKGAQASALLDFNSHNILHNVVPGDYPMWRRDLHEKYGYPDQEYKSFGMWEMWIRATEKGAEFLKIQQILAVAIEKPKVSSKQETSSSEISNIMNRHQSLLVPINQLKYDIDKKILKQFLPKNPIILDAGAYNGNDSVELIKLFPNGKIFAFEPVPAVHKQLMSTTKDYKNISCYPYALSDTTGKQIIYVSTGQYNNMPGVADASSSLLPPKDHLKICPRITFEEKIEIQAYNLDEWAAKHGVERIDFMWLDLQGYELPVLKAAPNILKNVTAIYTEVSLKELYEGMVLYDEYVAWFYANGFIKVWEGGVSNSQKNILFVRNNKSFNLN